MKKSAIVNIGDYELFYHNAIIEVKEHKGIYAFMNGSCIAHLKIYNYATVCDLTKIINKLNKL